MVHQDLDLDVQPGEILSLVGGSGTGKTVLLRQMLGLEQPTRGSVRGVRRRHQRSRRRQQLQRMRNRWGMLFQHGALFSALTVFDNIALPLRELRALPEDADPRRGAGQAADGRPQRRSMRTRCRPTCRAAWSSAWRWRARWRWTRSCCCWTSPPPGLDPTLRTASSTCSQSLHRELELTVVMVTHDLDTLFELSTRIAVLADKRVIAVGPPRK